MTVASEPPPDILRSDLICYINGKKHQLPYGRAECTLLQYLREQGLTGTKLGCGEGGCGACTVMVSSWEDGAICHRSVNACLAPLYSVEGMQVVTVEGLGNPRDGLHPVQERLALAHGSQCGFCTPGFVMSMYALLRSRGGRALSEEDIEENLAGNLCRCTGYRPILDAFRVFAKSDGAAYTNDALAAQNGEAAPGSVAAPNGTANGHEKGHQNGHANGQANGHAKGHANGNGKVCPSTGLPCDCGQPSPAVGEKAVIKKPAKAPCEPIFPPELKSRIPAALAIPGPKAAWYRPVTLEGLLKLKTAFPAAKLVGGNTEVGIEVKFKAAQYPTLISIASVPELRQIQVSDDGLSIGAGATLTALMDALRAAVAERAPHKTSACFALLGQLRWFAGNQVRNVATVGGNIVTGSPISDLNPLWIAAGATFSMARAGATPRAVPAANFFLGYRKVDLQPQEVLLSVQLPWTRLHEYVAEFKQAHRRDDDIAIVNAGMRVLLRQGTEGVWEIAEASLAFGGVAAKTVSAPKAEAAIRGQPLSQETLAAGLAALAEDIVIAPDAPGGMVEYRRSLAASFLFRFFASTAQKLQAEVPDLPPQLPAEFASAAGGQNRPPSRGLQYFSTVPDQDIVGQPVPHLASKLQVAGTAQYTDDIPPPPGTLHAALVTSAKPHARILAVHTEAALQIEGVEAYVDHTDVPGRNVVSFDEELFAATGAVHCVGYVIGCIVAHTEAAAREAARAVRVEYEELPALVSIEDAIAADSYFENVKHKLVTGDAAAAFAGCDHVLEGCVRIGGQEHFYLEPQCTLVVPSENDEMTVHSSSQNPTENQQVVAEALDLPSHKVFSHAKRLGGGFGGKEIIPSRLSGIAAVAAWKTRRPVRLCLDRDEDMHISGQRHAFMAKYKVGASKEGKIQALDVKLYNNAGCGYATSLSVMERATKHVDNAYHVPNTVIEGFCCRTNIASNTAFRGFGSPQAMMVAETYIDHIAKTVGRPPEAVRAANFYANGAAQPYGQPLPTARLHACWDLMMSSSEFEARRAEVDAFNAASRYRKRGLAAVPSKFGVAFTLLSMCQAGALVHIYTDGSVLVSHGGVEMGQGLHTKVAQVAAACLGVPLNRVYISGTSTDKIPNASPTAGSMSTDLYGAAVQDACSQLQANLAPFREAMPDASFKDIVLAAHAARVSLSAHALFKTPALTGWDAVKGGAMPYHYFTFGAGVCEVELDTLTGDHTVLRADLCMDVGRSINPAIDIGQVEGAFAQGQGWSTIEEVVWGDSEHPWVPKGVLHTRGPGTYKIPTANDIPLDLRVTLLPGSENEAPRAVHSSKAVGEPPLFLGASVFWALKDAVAAARKERGLEGFFPLDCPATPERLRMACPDDLTAPFASPDLRPKHTC